MASVMAARDGVQLWTLSRLLVNEKQVAVATRCLELCLAQPPSPEIALQATILLADCCLSLCSSEPKSANRELWWKRYKQAERCVYSAAESAGRAVIAREWVARLYKCKYQLVRSSKTERTVRDRLMLQCLCEGIRWCYEPSLADNSCAPMRMYFVTALRAELTTMHASCLQSGSLVAFEDNLKFVRSSMPNSVDADFQSWLIEVSCHVLVTMARLGGINEATNALGFADQWISSQQSPSSSMMQYHLILKSFHVLRTGEVKKLGALVDELKSLRSQTKVQAGTSPTDVYLDNIVDALELEVMSRYDPSQAVVLSMKAIHQVQANVQLFTANPSIHTLLLGLLFDMLFIHCDLQRQHCRYFEMGVSLAQLLKLYMAYKHHLESTPMFQYYVTQIDVMVAKYAFSVGKLREGEAHVRSVLRRYSAGLGDGNISYPLHYVRVLVEALDAATFSGVIADPVFVSSVHNRSQGVRILQICPTVPQLNLAAQILQLPNFRAVARSCGNIELSARYELALCKWLWASQELTRSGFHQGLHHHEWLEQFRPGMDLLLRDGLNLVSNHVNCTEATAEFMALFGPKLIEGNLPDEGEVTLKSALRLSLHARNVLLQARLLVDVFRLYGQRHLVQAQATTAEKYEKKIAQLHRRVTQAQAEQSTMVAILSWAP